MNNNTSTAYDDMPENVQDSSAVAPKKKNVAYRVFAALVVALAVGVFFLPYARFLCGFIPVRDSFFNTVKLLFTEPPYTAFGFLPTCTDVSYTSGLISTVALYALFFFTVLSVLFGIITIFCSKKAPAMLRVTVFFLAVGYAMYAVCITSLYYLYYGKLTLKSLDYVSVGMTIVTVLLFFVLACIKLKKLAIVNTLYWLLSAVVTAALLAMLLKDQLSLANGLDIFKAVDLYDIVFYALVGVAVVNLFIASIRVATKRGLIPDLIRYCLLLLVTGVLLFFQIKMSNDSFAFICSIVAVAVCVVQIVVASIHIAFAKKAKKAKKAKDAQPEAPVSEADTDEIVDTMDMDADVYAHIKAFPPVAAPQEVAEETYLVEQCAEAVPYEGGPVDGVEMAEAVTEDVQETPAPTAAPTVDTADYDYYNSKSFDPFIANLSREERNQFTELFILRCKGTMSEIPEYTVGANNKEFFRKIFIYLGQYRDRIPDNLLSKIYEFSLKI